MSGVTIRPLTASSAIRDRLSEIMIEAVAHGASVTFMHPLARATADAFWDRSLAAAERGERVVLGAWDGDRLAGTVTLALDCPENQPHRGEIGKLMTCVSHRGRGIARSLMLAAEAEAVARGRALLVLDTAEDGGAAGFYEGLGYVRAGAIPDYAYTPHGVLSAAIVFWKRIGTGAIPPVPS